MLVQFRTVLLLGVTLSSAFTPSLVNHVPRYRLRCSRPSKLAMSSTRQPEDHSAGRILDRPSGRSYMSESFSRELLADERFASVAPVKFAKDAKVAASGSLTRRQRIARLSGVLLESAKAVGTRVVAKLSKKAVSPKPWRTSAARAPAFVPTPRPAPPAKQEGTVDPASTVKLQPQLAVMRASSAPGSVASDSGTAASDRMESLIRGYAKKHGGAEEANKVVRSEAPSPEIGTGDDRLDQLLGGYSKRHGGGAPPRSKTTTLTAALDAPKTKIQRSRYADFGKSSEEQEQAAISARFTRSKSKEVAPDGSIAEEGFMSRVIMGGSLKAGTTRAGAVARRGVKNTVALQELAPSKPESRLDQLVMKYASKYEKGGSKGSIRAPSPSSQTVRRPPQAVVSYKTPSPSLSSVSEEVPAASAPSEPQSTASALEALSAEEEAPSGEEDSAGVVSGEGVESQ